MATGLRDIPRSEFGGDFRVQSTDLDPTLLTPLSTITAGSLIPNFMGLTVWNATGLTITAGQFVVVSGWHAATSQPQVILADADASGSPATYVALANISNGAAGVVGLHLLLTGQNTNAGNVGDPVYLSTTAGGYTLTAPTAANARVQIVGQITVKNTVTGVIDFDLRSNPLVKVGTNELQTGAATGNITQATLTPDQIGLTVANKTGSDIGAGKLVYINGYDTGLAMLTVALASASGQFTTAGWITVAGITNNTTGLVGQHFSLTAQNTNAATVGDAVYLDTTAGAYTLTSPPAAGQALQIVGRVAVKSATVGVVEMSILPNPKPVMILRYQSAFPTIATTGTTEGLVIDMPVSGTILGFRCRFNSALPVDVSNYVTFSANNRTQTKLLTSAVAANSTQTGAGSQAILQWAGFVLTVTGTASNLVVAVGDAVNVTAVVTGTLGSAINGIWDLVMVPN